MADIKGVWKFVYLTIGIEGSYFSMAGLRVEVRTWQRQYSAFSMVLRAFSGSWPPRYRGFRNILVFYEMRTSAPRNPKPEGEGVAQNVRHNTVNNNNDKMKTQRSTEITFHVLFTSPLCGFQWSGSGSSCLVPRGIVRVTCSLDILCICLGGLVVSVLATGCGFNPGRGRWIFKGDKNP
jgi:hypothetical protein